MLQGSCLCGGVKYQAQGPLSMVARCHCDQCRKQSGHFYAATNAKDDAISLEGAEHVTWYRASEIAKRGFCRHCGSALFWKPDDGDYTSILAGGFDQPSGLKLTKHIFVADKGDYYKIEDDAEQFADGGTTRLS